MPNTKIQREISAHRIASLSLEGPRSGQVIAPRSRIFRRLCISAMVLAIIGSAFVLFAYPHVGSALARVLLPNAR